MMQQLLLRNGVLQEPLTLAKGVTINLRKRGVSVSMGPRGAKYTVGTSGQRATVGLPSSGLFYTVGPKTGGEKRSAPRGRSAPVPARDRPTPNFVYGGMGQSARARAEFERLYAEDPGYEDVSSRLGR
jgi:hypothetical protein